LGEYLAEYGGLERAMRRTYDFSDAAKLKRRQRTGLTKATERLTAIMQSPSDANASGDTT
jgi:hypothetical protein